MYFVGFNSLKVLSNELNSNNEVHMTLKKIKTSNLKSVLDQGLENLLLSCPCAYGNMLTTFPIFCLLLLLAGASV